MSLYLHIHTKIMVIHFITSAVQKEGAPKKHRRERWEYYGQMFLFPEGPKTMSGKKNCNPEEKLDGLKGSKPAHQYCTQNRYKSTSNKVSDCEWRHEKTHSYVPRNFEFLKLKLWALQILHATATKTNTVTAMRLPAYSYCKKETQSYYKHWIRPTVRKNGRICNNCSFKMESELTHWRADICHLHLKNRR